MKQPETHVKCFGCRKDVPRSQCISMGSMWSDHPQEYLCESCDNPQEGHIGDMVDAVQVQIEERIQ